MQLLVLACYCSCLKEARLNFCRPQTALQCNAKCTGHSNLSCGLKGGPVGLCSLQGLSRWKQNIECGVCTPWTSSSFEKRHFRRFYTVCTEDRLALPLQSLLAQLLFACRFAVY